jgi:hypothetical protein
MCVCVCVCVCESFFSSIFDFAELANFGFIIIIIGITWPIALTLWGIIKFLGLLKKKLDSRS